MISDYVTSRVDKSHRWDTYNYSKSQQHLLHWNERNSPLRNSSDVCL